jgi:hypothetical protein
MIQGLFVVFLIGAAAYFFDENQRFKKRINHLLNDRKEGDE